MIIRAFAMVVVLWGVRSPALHAADEPPQFSGPQVGEKLPALPVRLAYGDEAGQVVDFVELAGDRPMLVVIVNGANRPAAGLTRSLMNFAEMQGERLFAGVVYLDDDLSAAETYLRQATSWWGVGPQVGISVDGAEGPGSYGLNRNVNLTILVAEKGHVSSNYALVQPSLADAPRILTDVVALAGGRVPTTEAEVAFLSISTRSSGPVAWRGTPTDVQMRKLLCDAIAAEDDAHAQSAAQAVEEYVGDDSDRQAALGNAAAVLLGGKKYVEAIDRPIAGQLKRWREKYDVHPEGRQKLKAR